jgi:P27 family predicted phage terminase small subunit
MVDRNRRAKTIGLDDCRVEAGRGIMTSPPPKWLDEQARREWQRLVDERSFAADELPALAAYCYALSSWCEARSVLQGIERDSLTGWSDEEGNRHPHPVYAVEALLATELRALTDVLGLEPLGREPTRPTRILFLDEGVAGDD